MSKANPNGLDAAELAILDDLVELGLIRLIPGPVGFELTEKGQDHYNTEKSVIQIGQDLLDGIDPVTGEEIDPAEYTETKQ